MSAKKKTTQAKAKTGPTPDRAVFRRAREALLALEQARLDLAGLIFTVSDKRADIANPILDSIGMLSSEMARRLTRAEELLGGRAARK